MGYSLAGFEVVGVDIEPQPDYPFEFYQDDALDFLERLYDDPSWIAPFDCIHASPPCQGYSNLNALWKRDYPLLIEPVRRLLVRSGKPFVMENVEGSDLAPHVVLCGRMFGMPIRRHRLFELGGWWCMTPGHPRCVGLPDTLGVYGASDGAHEPGFKHPGRKRGPRQATTIEAREVMGMPWATKRHGITEAIPPAFTEYLGSALLSALEVAA